MCMVLCTIWLYILCIRASGHLGTWCLEIDSLVSLEHHDVFARIKASRYWSNLCACDFGMHSKLGTSAILV